MALSALYTPRPAAANVLMAAGSLCGLFIPGVYRDPASVVAALPGTAGRPGGPSAVTFVPGWSPAESGG